MQVEVIGQAPLQHKNLWSVYGQQAFSPTFYSIGREEGQVASFQRVVWGAIRIADLWLGLPGQRGVVHFEAVSRQDTDVTRDTVTKGDVHQVSYYKLLSVNVQFLAVTDNHRKLAEGQRVTF